MPKIILIRSIPHENLSRSIRILIDGKSIGTINHNETKEYEVEPGQHIVQAKIDWCTSNSLELNLGKSDTVRIVMRAGAGSPLYRITFGRKNYLKLELVSS